MSFVSTSSHSLLFHRMIYMQVVCYAITPGHIQLFTSFRGCFFFHIWQLQLLILKKYSTIVLNIISIYINNSYFMW